MSEYRAEIAVPAALVDRILGDDRESGIATGADDSDPASKAVRLAFEAGHEGQHSVRILATAEVIGVISEFARGMTMGGQEVEPWELRAGEAWFRNVEAFRENMCPGGV